MQVITSRRFRFEAAEIFYPEARRPSRSIGMDEWTIGTPPHGVNPVGLQYIGNPRFSNSPFIISPCGKAAGKKQVYDRY